MHSDLRNAVDCTSVDVALINASKECPSLADGLPELWQGSCQAHDLITKLLHRRKVVCCITCLLFRIGCGDVAPDRGFEIHTICLFAVNSQEHGGLHHLCSLSLRGCAFVVLFSEVTGLVHSSPLSFKKAMLHY